MSNVSLADVRGICDAFLADPSLFAPELAHLNLDATFFKETCLHIAEIVLELDEPPEAFWPLHIRIFMTLIFGILSLIGILGNVLVMLVIARLPEMRTPTNFYLFSLALADCLFFLAASPTELSYLHTPGSTFMFGDVACALFTYIPYLAINTSSLSITAFAVERYIGICHPLKARSLCTLARAKAIIVAIWVFCVLYNAPWLYLATLTRVYGGATCSFKFNRDNTAYKVLYFADLGLFYAVPMVLNLVIYGKIIYTLNKCAMKIESSVQGRKGDEMDRLVPPTPFTTKNSAVTPLKCSKKSSIRNKMQVIRMMCIVVIVFAVCWVPYRSLVMYNSFAEHKIHNDVYIFFAKTLLFINGAINPVLYNLMSTRFRNAFKKLSGRVKASLLTSRTPTPMLDLEYTPVSHQ